MTEPVAPDPNPEQTAAMMAKVRRMMLIAGLTTALGIGALLVVIGYRLFRSEGSVVTAVSTATLPKGARILSTAVVADRVILTLDIAGSTEIRTYDAKTLKPVATLKFAQEP
ncbi:hypothetical protein [Tardiphaga sp.]|uniref:hypothetical protein n=1 Tax=Tardiphaga sp. TaxID=1926292 RepID=UPI001987FDF4|nr:hypothetical protein [Tardiphaga sp.]MBC7579243.1 hypothetical protein [Tardiphaga sp.]